MTGLRSQRSMKRGSTPTPVCSELRLFSREAITGFEELAGWVIECNGNLSSVSPVVTVFEVLFFEVL